MLTIQNYKKVESLEEAYELNQKKANRIVGGMMWMRMGDNRMNTAIDMSGLGLDKIEESDEEFKIGCMTTLRQLEVHESFNEYTDGCAKEALRHIVGVQFRNLATVGGSIYGRYGFSDVLTLLIGLDSYVELYKGGIVPLTEYADRDYDRDIVVNIIVKKRPVNMFYEAVRITETDLPVLEWAFRGIRAAVAVLVLEAGAKMLLKLRKKPQGRSLRTGLAAAGFGLALLARVLDWPVSTIELMLLAGIAGVLLFRETPAGKGAENP